MTRRAYPKYKDSGIEWIGEIPAHWETMALRRVIDKFVDYRGRTPEKVESGIPLITAKNVKNGKIDFSLSQKFIQEENYDDWMVRGMPQCGDVLVTTEAPLGESTQIEGERIALAQRIILFKANKEKLRNDYLKYHFLANSGKGELWSNATGSTALGIKADKLKGTKITLPPSNEQSQIAAFLDHETSRIDTLISKKERQIELLKEKRSALITHAVTKGLNPDAKMKDSGIEWIGEIPEGWGSVPLKWLLRIKSGEYLPNLEFEKELTEDHRFPVIGGNGILGYSTKTNVSRPTIAVGRVGALCGNVHSITGNTWITDNALFLTDLRKINLDYLLFALNTMNLNKLANQNAQPLITSTMIKSQYIPLPMEKEQLEIVNFLDRETSRIDKLIDKVQNSIETLKEYRAAIISAAVTGKIDVRDWKNEAAA